jgi:hypothetical protein
MLPIPNAINVATILSTRVHLRQSLEPRYWVARYGHFESGVVPNVDTASKVASSRPMPQPDEDRVLQQPSVKILRPPPICRIRRASWGSGRIDNIVLVTHV